MLLRRGSRGEEVKEIQVRLSELGFYSGLTDGIFGPATESAVIRFQAYHGLVVDGLAGTRTLKELRGDQREPWQLAEVDLKVAADTLRVPLSSIHAVAEVETKNSGFIDLYTPEILFERHWMYRQAKKRNLDVDTLKLDHPDIINPTPGGYLGGEREYDKLNRAKAINIDSAIEAASWGRFQIMGFHWERLGFESPTEFEISMRQTEAHHLQAFVKFIQTDARLHQALRLEDWDTFAMIYNGRNYDRIYVTRIKEAKERFKQLDIA